MVQIRLYNSASRKVEDFVAQDNEHIKMYVCGPTPYSYAHIGNARPVVVFDVLARLLRSQFTKLTYVRNITDVDDKINMAAEQENVPISVISERYTKAYHHDLAQLNVAVPDREPKVTEHIQPICAFIQKLIDLRFAYVAESHVLFSVKKYKKYGKLSGHNPEALLAGARIEVASYKENAGDFVLWKPSDSHQPGWDSPWGKGRPGWHIECSAMVAEHLGETIDIHGGGNDLLFPHHENELAQSECAHGGKTYARYWMHNGLVNMGTEKMSKSLGNIVLLKDLLNKAPAEAVRYALLSAHYRAPLEWSDSLLLQAKKSLDRLYGALRVLHDVDSVSECVIPENFMRALAEDMNTPKALAVLFALAKKINTTDMANVSLSDKKQLKAQLQQSATMLGLLQSNPSIWFTCSTTLTDDEIETLIDERDKAKEDKNWVLADKIRDQLQQANVILEDGAQGTRWRSS